MLAFFVKLMLEIELEFETSFIEKFQCVKDSPSFPTLEFSIVKEICSKIAVCQAVSYPPPMIMHRLLDWFCFLKEIPFP